MSTIQKIVGRRSRLAKTLIGTSICPYFHFCVRGMNGLGDTLGRRSRLANILIGTPISPYIHFCVRDMYVLGDTVGGRSRQAMIFIETFFILHEYPTKDCRKA